MIRKDKRIIYLFIKMPKLEENPLKYSYNDLNINNDYRGNEKHLDILYVLNRYICISFDLKYVDDFTSVCKWKDSRK